MPLNLEERIRHFTKGSGSFVNEKFWHSVLGYWLTGESDLRLALYNLMALTARKENLVFHSPAKSINSDLLVVTPAEIALIEVKVAGRWQHYQRLLYAHQIHSVMLRDPGLFQGRTAKLILISHDRDLKKFPRPSGICDVQHESVKQHRILLKYSFELVGRHDDANSSDLEYQITLTSAEQNPKRKKDWRKQDERRLSALQAALGVPFLIDVCLVSWEEIRAITVNQMLPVERFWPSRP